MVEGGAPNALMRNGWNRNSVPAGTKVHVEGFQAKDRSFRASGREITLPAGRACSWDRAATPRRALSK
jgi:hypothetical protein